MYQNSSILIMDEATSALDIRSELMLKEALRNLMTNHTVTELFLFTLCSLVLQDTSSVMGTIINILLSSVL